MAVWARRKWSYLLRFFAGTCWVINGAYIGAGWIVDAGDAGVMRELGTPIWVMLAYGAVCCGLGLWMWHGLAKRFAEGTRAEAIAATAALCLLVWIGWGTAG